MIASIELQVISKILLCLDEELIEKLLQFDRSYYSIFQSQYEFIQDHYDKYGNVPDMFTFQAQFPDITVVQVSESFDYLKSEMIKNKKHIMLLDMFNKIKDLGSDDVDDAWKYIENQCEKVDEISEGKPIDIVHDVKIRANQIIEFNKKSRIPTGFSEIDKVMYGGFSTVEELVLVFARTNSGKSWVCTKMMESAQKNGFPVLYYSPEMQSSFLGTRFDTWRKHFKNSELHMGKYSQEYLEYMNELENDSTSAYVIEDKDCQDGVVNVPVLSSFVKKYAIKLLIVDGLSYVEDTKKNRNDSEKYKNLCNDLFRLSKKYSCAVVIAMQANRETRENREKSADGKDPFPSLYNIEGSDHPARIATQAFAIRQVWDQHILDIRMEKSRNAANQKPEFSYSWDPNTGNISLIADNSSSRNISSNQNDTKSSEFKNSTITSFIKMNNPDVEDLISEVDDEDDDEDVQF